MNVDENKLIYYLEQIKENYDLTEEEKWALIITIAHLEDIKED